MAGEENKSKVKSKGATKAKSEKSASNTVRKAKSTSASNSQAKSKVKANAEISPETGKRGGTKKEPTAKTASRKKPGAERKSKSTAQELTVILKRSGIGRPKDQRATLTGLGFKRLNQKIVVSDTPEVRGMIRKVAHLVEVQ